MSLCFHLFPLGASINEVDSNGCSPSINAGVKDSTEMQLENAMLKVKEEKERSETRLKNVRLKDGEKTLSVENGRLEDKLGVMQLIKATFKEKKKLCEENRRLEHELGAMRVKNVMLGKDMKRLREENERLEEERMCTICLERPKSCSFNCGHMKMFEPENAALKSNEEKERSCSKIISFQRKIILT